MSEQTAPYYIETITQRLARLGVELAGLMAHQHERAMLVETINRMNDRIEAIVAEILQISENWDKSNE
jgi:hypothetical protein